MTQKIEVAEQASPSPVEEFRADDWFQAEGELAVDVYQTEKDMVVQAAVAGVRPEELDIQLERDAVTIRGLRKNPFEEEQKQYLHEECFWGVFSRQIFLPEEADAKAAEAVMQDGVLTLRLPKLMREQVKKVQIQKK